MMRAITSPSDPRLNDISEEQRDITDAELDLAVEQYGCEDIGIDSDAKVADIEGSKNLWVQAWVYVRVEGGEE